MPAADSDIRSVFTGKERRQHKQAFSALGKHIDAMFPHLRSSLGASLAARRTPAASA